MITTRSNILHRRFDPGRKHLRLPEILDSLSISISTAFTDRSFPPLVGQVFPRLDL